MLPDRVSNRGPDLRVLYPTNCATRPGSTLMCLDIGTKQTIHIPVETNGKLMILGVAIL